MYLLLVNINKKQQLTTDKSYCFLKSLIISKISPKSIKGHILNPPLVTGHVYFPECYGVDLAALH